MQRHRQATHAIIFVLLLLTSRLSADEYFGQPGEFLRYSPSARALAMGRAYTAVGQDANALHWNPGALAQLRKTGLSLVGTQASLFGLSNYSSLSLGLPFEIIDSPFFQKLNHMTMGISFLNLTSDITGANEIGIVDTGSSLGISQGAFSLALASSNNIKYLSDFSLGVGLDVIWNDLFGKRKTSTGLNAGLYYHNADIDVLNWFTFALAFKNINEPNIAVNSGIDESVPGSGKFGIAFIPPFCSTLPQFFRPLTVAFDFDVVAVDGQKRGFYLGLEYNISRLESYLPIRLRLGTNSKESAFTFGLSLDLPANPFMKKGLEYLPSLDYSFNFYGDNDYLGDVKQGGISFAWSPRTPKDWYEEGMQYFPSVLLSPLNEPKGLVVAQNKLQRVFDNPQALANPNYAEYGNNAMLRLGDLQIASRWLKNDKRDLLASALKIYSRAGECVPLDDMAGTGAANSTSLLYRLQAEIKSGMSPEQIFAQPYVGMIDDQEHVQFLRGYAYYAGGSAEQAVAEWQSLDLPIAKYLLAKATGDAAALKKLAFSNNTSVSTKILFPFYSDFDIGDNALFDLAEMSNEPEWKKVILKLYPLSELYQQIIKSL